MILLLSILKERFEHESLSSKQLPSHGTAGHIIEWRWKGAFHSTETANDHG